MESWILLVDQIGQMARLVVGCKRENGMGSDAQNTAEERKERMDVKCVRILAQESNKLTPRWKQTQRRVSTSRLPISIATNFDLGSSEFPFLPSPISSLVLKSFSCRKTLDFQLGCCFWAKLKYTTLQCFVWLRLSAIDNWLVGLAFQMVPHLARNGTHTLLGTLKLWNHLKLKENTLDRRLAGYSTHTHTGIPISSSLDILEWWWWCDWCQRRHTHSGNYLDSIESSF